MPGTALCRGLASLLARRMRSRIEMRPPSGAPAPAARTRRRPSRWRCAGNRRRAWGRKLGIPAPVCTTTSDPGGPMSAAPPRRTTFSEPLSKLVVAYQECARPAARRAFSANLPITQCDAVSRHSLMPTVGAMRRDRLGRVRPSKISAVELARVSRPLSAAVSFLVSLMHHLCVGGRVAADAPEVPPGHRRFSLRRL
jgi:hypothetical protein